MAFSLYYLDKKLDDFMEMWEASLDAGEELDDEVLQDTLDSIEGDINYKLNSTVGFYKRLCDEAEALKKRKEEIYARQKAKEKLAERIKERLAFNCINANRMKWENTDHKLSFRSSQAVVVDDETKLIEYCKENRDDLLIFKEPTLNRTNLRKALKGADDTDELKGLAHIEDKKNIQIK